METVATLAVGLVVDVGGAFKQIETGMGKLANVAATAGKAIAVGIGVGTAAIVAFGKSSVEAATSFEAQMAILSTAADLSAVSMDDLHDAALKIGADNELIGITASQAAEALTNFYKAGLSTEDVFVNLNAYMEEGASLSGAMRAAIDLQAASEYNLAEASELVAVSMATYGLEAAEATRISNALVQAADSSVANVSDLGVALSYVGPQAATMNIELEDTLNALAILSERGIKGSRAGTTLRRVLADLVKGTEKSSEALAELGVELYNVDGSMRPLRDIISDLDEAYAGLTDKERDLYNQAIFTVRGRVGINAILEDGVEGWDKMAAAMESASTAEEVAAARTATFAAKMERLEGVIETLRIMAGEALLPVLGRLADMFNEFVGNYTPQIVAAFEWLAGTVDKVVTAVEVFFTGLSTGQSIVESFGNVLTYLLPEDTANRIMGFVTEIVTAFEGGWPGIRDLLFEWAGRFWDWITAPGGVAELAEGKLQDVIDAIGEWVDDVWPGIAAKLAEWGNKFWDWIVDVAVPQAMERLGELAQAFRDWAESSEGESAMYSVGETLAGLLVDGIGAAFSLLIPGMGGTISESLSNVAFSLGEMIANFVEGFIDGVAEKLGIDLPPRFSEIVGDILSKIIFPLPLVLELGEGVMENLEPFRAVLEKVGTLIEIIVGPALEELGIAWEELKTAFSDAWAELKPIFDEIVMAFGEAFGVEEGEATFADAVRTIIGFIGKLVVALSIVNLKVIAEGIKKFAKTVAKIAKVVGKVAKAIAKWWEKYGGKIKKVFIILVKFLKLDWEKAWLAARALLFAVLAAIWKKVKDIWDAVWRKIRDTLDDIWKKVKDIWDAVWRKIRDTLDDILKKVRDVWDAILTKIRQVLDDILKKVRDVWDAILTKIRQVLDDILRKVREVWDAILTKIRQVLDDILKKVRDVWDAILTKIRQVLDDILRKVREVWDAILTKIRQVLDDIWRKVQEVWDDILVKIRQVLDDILRKVEEWARELYNTFRDALLSLLDAIDEVADDLIDLGRQIIEFVMDGIESVGDFASRFGTWLGQQLDSLLTTVTDWFSSAFAVGRQIIAMLIDGMQTGTVNIPWIGEVPFVNAIAGLLWWWFYQIRTTVTSWIESVVATGKKIVQKIADGMVTWWVKVYNALIDVLNEAWNKLFGWRPFKRLPEEAGQGMADGIAQGIRDGANAVNTAMVALVDGAFDAAARAAGAQSPSKLFAELGKDITAGLGIGIVSGMPNVASLLRGSIAGVAATAGGTYSATFNTNVYNEMDMRRLEFMVEDILRGMSQRGY